MKFQRTDYKKLSGKQQEIHNPQKVTGVSANYAFNHITLADWLGADFFIFHTETFTHDGMSGGVISPSFWQRSCDSVITVSIY